MKTSFKCNRIRQRVVLPIDTASALFDSEFHATLIMPVLLATIDDLPCLASPHPKSQKMGGGDRVAARPGLIAP